MVFSRSFVRNIYTYILYLCVSSNRLEGTEEKFRNRESRPEDLQVIAELKEMVSEREALVKKLVVGTADELIPKSGETVIYSRKCKKIHTSSSCEGY